MIPQYHSISVIFFSDPASLHGSTEYEEAQTLLNQTKKDYKRYFSIL